MRRAGLPAERLCDDGTLPSSRNLPVGWNVCLMATAIFCLHLAGFLWAGIAWGDVVSQADAGFQLRITASVRGTPATVFDALTNRVGQWWDPAHTYGGDSSQLSIEPRAGGCFCEKLPDGEVEHLTVSYVDKDRELRLLGGLGPLQGLGAHGAMSFSLTSSDGVTHLVVIYHVSGYFPDGTNDWAPVVDRVLSEQVQRLKSHVEASAT